MAGGHCRFDSVHVRCGSSSPSSRCPCCRRRHFIAAAAILLLLLFFYCCCCYFFAATAIFSSYSVCILLSLLSFCLVKPKHQFRLFTFHFFSSLISIDIAYLIFLSAFNHTLFCFILLLSTNLIIASSFYCFRDSLISAFLLSYKRVLFSEWMNR